MTETYAIRLDKIARMWPDERDPPPLIETVADYLRDKRLGLVGYFRLSGDRSNDWWIENGADLANEFGIFMRLPEGSLIAVWYHEGAVPGTEPIVYIGSEGESYVCGATLAGFFESIASLRQDERLPYEFHRDPEDEEDASITDERPAFLSFLMGLPGWAPTVSAKDINAPDITKRFNGWQQAQIEAIAGNSTLQSISRILDTRIPRGKESWQGVNFGIAAAGDRISVHTLDYNNRKALPESPALVPFIRQAREERALSGPPQRGAWHKASLLLNPDGICRIQADWSEAPEFPDNSMPTRAELNLDLARFPRGARWIEPWMEDLK